MSRIRENYRRLKGAGRLRILPGISGAAELTARCRVGRSRKFSLWARIKFLFVGQIWVATINGKEHTQVVLTMRQPRDKEIAAAEQQSAEVAKRHDEQFGAKFRG